MSDRSELAMAIVDEVWSHANYRNATLHTTMAKRGVSRLLAPILADRDELRAALADLWHYRDAPVSAEKDAAYDRVEALLAKGTVTT